jgi:hypothetical protein
MLLLESKSAAHWKENQDDDQPDQTDPTDVVAVAFRQSASERRVFEQPMGLSVPHMRTEDGQAMNQAQVETTQRGPSRNFFSA